MGGENPALVSTEGEEKIVEGEEEESGEKGSEGDS